jgi:hypothetical protein
MKESESEFIFAITNTGSESALKLETETMKLGWRPSYQHKGFVTFKSPIDGKFSLDKLNQMLAFARRICLSLGRFSSEEEAEKMVKCHSAYHHGAIHHVHYAEWKMSGNHDEPIGHPEIGECIGTVVQVGPTEFWAGLHRHSKFLSPDPGGDSALEMPKESPSRAWLKLEAADRFFNLNFTRKDIAVELGCAPGGVVLALLRRGISVIGVDPAKMAEVVTQHSVAERRDVPIDRAWFYHCRKPAALAAKRDLGQDVTWFMSDMNQSPEVVIKECSRFCVMAPSIRGVLVTLKLTHFSQIREKQKWFDALAEMKFKTIRLQQFSVHHKELALLAIR